MITVLPTLNRLKLLQTFLNSALECNTTTPGIIVVDTDDYSKNQKAYDSLAKPNGWTLYISNAVTMGDKIRETEHIWNKHDAVCILNDDHVIKTKDWDVKLLSKIDGTNFVTCQDNWMSPRKAAGATVWSIELLKTVGIPIYPPKMTHLFIDDFWEIIGKGTGVWDIDHSVTIEHNNQLKSPQERDSTFHKVYGTGPDLTQHELWKNDEKACQDFLKSEYLSIRNRIRKLRGQTELVMNS